MQSVAVLGDVGVYELDGFNLEKHFQHLSSHQPPRIYEGATLAGEAIKQALAPLDLSATPRIARYETPLDKYQQDGDRSNENPYPFDRFINFRAESDPLGTVSVKWRVESKKSPKPDKPRRRLSDPVPTGAHAFGVHSRTLLESLRTGGLFEYSEELQQHRNEYTEIRATCLRWSAWQAIHMAEREGHLPLSKNSTAVANPGRDKPISQWQCFAEMRAALKQISMSEAPNLDRTPDVLVLYDLHRVIAGSSRPHTAGTRGPATSRHTLFPTLGQTRGAMASQDGNGLRSVRFPEDFPWTSPYGQSSGGNSKEAEDTLCVLKAWIGRTYAFLIDGCTSIIQDECRQQARPVTRLQADLLAAKYCADSCAEITTLYADVVIGGSLQVSDLRFGGKKIADVWTAYVERPEWKSAAAGDADYGEPQRSGTARHELFDAVVRLTMSRLVRSERWSKDLSPVPYAKPLIVTCLKTLDMPNLAAENSGTGAASSANYLSTLYRSQWLRDRTVVILDADCLRRLDEDPAGISSQSSWEETAMDTVDAFQHRNRLRPYLDFGYVIVRYGVTGALLLSRQPNGELSVRLFFDPDKTDRDWTQGDDGEVLGHTSIFAASIVQAMTYKCNERKSEPVLSDTIEMLHHAIRMALMRCQQWFSFAYGPAQDESKGDPDAWTMKAAEALFKRNGVYPNLFHLFHDPDVSQSDVFAEQIAKDANDADRKKYEADVEAAAAVAANWISTSIVPAIRSQQWSIVEESCASDIDTVAYNIAHQGLPTALNKRERTRDDVILQEAQRLMLSCCEFVNKVLAGSTSETRELKQRLLDRFDAAAQVKYLTDQLGNLLRSPFTDTNDSEQLPEGFKQQLRDYFKQRFANRQLTRRLESTLEAHFTDLNARKTLSKSLTNQIRKTLKASVDAEQLASRFMELLQEHVESTVEAEELLQCLAKTPISDDEVAEGIKQQIRELKARIDEYSQAMAKSDPLTRSVAQLLKQHFEASGGAEQTTEGLKGTFGQVVKEIVPGLTTVFEKCLRDDESIGISGKTITPSDGVRPALRAIGSRIRETLVDSHPIDVISRQKLTQYSAPIARFGPQKEGEWIRVIDRREVEGIAAVKRLIVQYVQDLYGKPKGRPLSIAVFGPPGSGKSTAVKRIAKAHPEQIEFGGLEFNLAQFTDVNPLDDAFAKVSKQKGKIPLVFFDEFDSKFGETDFGWLKYFLAPMEDGKFGERIVGPAIFVFAGGTSYNFNEFSPKHPAPSDERWINFSRAKGPDFISRLSGHLSIIGINPTDPDDGLYLLRRAVLIRAILKEEGAVDEVSNRAMVDDPRVLRAILHAPSYRYGGRSLRMLIKACQDQTKWIRRCNIPAAHELEMLVDSKSFLATLREK